MHAPSAATPALPRLRLLREVLEMPDLDSPLTSLPARPAWRSAWHSCPEAALADLELQMHSRRASLDPQLLWWGAAIPPAISPSLLAAHDLLPQELTLTLTIDLHWPEDDSSMNLTLAGARLLRRIQTHLSLLGGASPAADLSYLVEQLGIPLEQHGAHSVLLPHGTSLALGGWGRHESLQPGCLELHDDAAALNTDPEHGRWLRLRLLREDGLCFLRFHLADPEPGSLTGFDLRLLELVLLALAQSQRQDALSMPELHAILCHTHDVASSGCHPSLMIRDASSSGTALRRAEAWLESLPDSLAVRWFLSLLEAPSGLPSSQLRAALVKTKAEWHAYGIALARQLSRPAAKASRRRAKASSSDVS